MHDTLWRVRAVPSVQRANRRANGTVTTATPSYQRVTQPAADGWWGRSRELRGHRSSSKGLGLPGRAFSMHSEGSQAAAASEAMCARWTRRARTSVGTQGNSSPQWRCWVWGVQSGRLAPALLFFLFFFSPSSSLQHLGFSSALSDTQSDPVYCVPTPQQRLGLWVRRGRFLQGSKQIRSNLICLKMPFLLQNLASPWYQRQI